MSSKQILSRDGWIKPEEDVTSLLEDLFKELDMKSGLPMVSILGHDLQYYYGTIADTETVRILLALKQLLSELDEATE